jgi:hypothetical protein
MSAVPAAEVRVIGDVAQLGEHRLCKAGVEGSIPFVSIFPKRRPACPQ